MARAIARDLTVFIVPDARFARAVGLDIEAAGLRPVMSPRHASVLLIVGELPAGLARAAAVAYGQMPRPRVIMAAGGSSVPGLPAPDIATPLDQAALITGVTELRRKIANGSFSPEAAALDIAAVRTATEYVCPMHPEIVRDESGSCPICGMNLVPRQTVGTTTEHGHANMPMDHATGPPEHTVSTIHSPPVLPVAKPADSRFSQSRAMAPPAQVPTTDGYRGPRTVSYTCPMHSQIVRSAPGRCPLCGMTLVPLAEGPDQPDHASTDHGGHQSHEPRAEDHGAKESDQMAVNELAPHGAAQPAPNMATNHGGGHEGHPMEAFTRAPRGHGDQEAPLPGEPADMDLGAMGHSMMDHSMMGHSMMDHSMMDREMTGHNSHPMGSGGFMSMIAITKDLPRSRDGLPMEWVDVPFGPLFPGVPGGLALTLTLDGDTVARAALTLGATHRGLVATWLGPAAAFSDRLARIDPLAPVAYRLLAWRALDAVADSRVNEAAERGRIGGLERERAASHLGWLAAFCSLLGTLAVARRAATLQLALRRATCMDELAARRSDVQALLRDVERTPLIRQRLAGIADLRGAPPETMWGPVSRAVGVAVDERAAEPAYGDLGFAPAVEESGDALARLRVRLAETRQSLDLVLAAGSLTPRESPLAAELAGAGTAAVETPRGAAILRLEVEAGQVTRVDLDDRSRLHALLVPRVAEGAEVADALVGVASLDLSPWAIDQ